MEIIPNKSEFAIVRHSDDMTATILSVHFKMAHFMSCEFHFHEKQQGRVCGSAWGEEREGTNYLIIL